MVKEIKQKFIVETESETRFTSEDVLYALRDNFMSDNLSVKEDENVIEITKEKLIELLKEKMKRLYPKDDQPDFHIGDLVRVRNDAESIYGEYFDEGHHDRWETGLIAGFDEVRQKRRGEVGFVEDIAHVPMKVKKIRFSNFMYEVRYGDNVRITMCGTWLERGTPPFIEGKEITTHPPIVPEHFKHERRTVELAVGQLDNTWHTTNVDIPKDTPNDKIEEVAVKQLTKELGEQEVAFITLYHISPIEE